jgi:hypothetical protein
MPMQLTFGQVKLVLPLLAPMLIDQKGGST